MSSSELPQESVSPSGQRAAGCSGGPLPLSGAVLPQNVRRGVGELRVASFTGLDLGCIAAKF